MESRPKILFVDDEENIRLTLGLYLESEGFAVTLAGTVAEALKRITAEKFDVLIADLNVGQPGDGFTVVSAMRRIHPQAVTFILTGYPAFETALEAIRLQVDDYLTKPTDMEALLAKVRSKLAEPSPPHHIDVKRLPEIISENMNAITVDWLKSVKQDKELAKIRISDAERKDHIPRVLQAATKTPTGKALGEQDLEAAAEHGKVRRKQKYTIPLLIREARLLQTAIASCAQQNLLAIAISYLISDLIAVQETIEALLEKSARAFLKQ